MNIHFSSEQEEWLTPRKILDRTVALFGTIDLDPCAEGIDSGNVGILKEWNVPARMHYSIVDDGLSQPQWGGKVFMNPPYGRKIGLWIEKILTEYDEGHICEAIILVPARTDTKWFQPLLYWPVCLVKGRLHFLSNEGIDNSAPFPSAIVYLGHRFSKFYSEFSSLGRIVSEV